MKCFGKKKWLSGLYYAGREEGITDARKKRGHVNTSEQNKPT